MTAQKRLLLLTAALFLLAADRGWTQNNSNWRVYQAADGLRESYVTTVTVSPRGNVWVKHGEADAISWLDGYSINSVAYSTPSLVERTYRVYESRSGEIWTLYNEGIEAFRDGQWVKYPIKEIRTEFQGGIIRQLRPIPLLPGDPDRVLFVLADRLVEFNAAANQTTVVRRVDETGLGKFLDLGEARDGGIWVSGQNGLMKRPGVVRSNGPQPAWQEFRVDKQLGVQNLQRPIEDDEGGVTTVAETESVLRKERVLVYFDGKAWEQKEMPGGKIHSAWRGSDGVFWAHSRDSLFSLDPTRGGAPEQASFLAGQYLDVAVDPNAKGSFWLATSEGLVRYAPLTWRMPGAMPGVNALIHAILEDRAGRLWFASASALMVYHDAQWERFPFPEDVELSFQATDALYSLPDGDLVISARDRFLRFNYGARRFQFVTHPSARPVEVLGQFKDGALCVQVLGREGARNGFRLEKFDGRTFVPFLRPEPDWTLGDQLVFASTARNGDLWLGGTAGLGLYRDGKLQTFDPADGTVPSRPLCILEFPDGVIWCGDQGKISEFNGRTWSIVRTGFERVNAMALGQDKSIWAASSSGLYRLYKGFWVMNGIEEGLPSAAVYQVFADRQGQIWAGTARGLSRYYPEADVDPPRTFLTEVNHRKKILMDNPVTFLCSGRDKWKYTPAERLLFSYRLDGNKWMPYTPSSSILFNQLAPGDHRLEVKAMDRNWNEDPTPAVYEFAIVLPWYLETRLLVVLFSGLALAVVFAGIAVNRHLRLVRSYAEVEQIVAQRTGELEQANRALLHSQKMKALGTLAAGIAHDFNSILSIIKGSAQIIETNLGDNEKILTRLDRIKTVVEQGAGIVKAMLGYSRASNQPPAWCQVNTVVADTISLLGDRFLHEVSVRLEAGPRLPDVLGEKDLIQQMLLNLILNAADAMAGHGQVVLRTGILSQLPAYLVLPPESADRFVWVAVVDTGSGIAPDVLPRIFEPFFTTKAFSSRRGTGLGLSMVYEFAKDLGYGLTVESTVGRGSVFTILMPVKARPGGERLSA